LDGEAVSQDAGQGDWGGGLLDWDLPQEEEQQEQGFVEGEYDPGSEYDTGSDYDTDSEYDPGFIPGSEYDPGYDPEGGYDPGSEYDPVFTWGDFEDYVGAEEPVEASAADPWGGTQPPEYTGWAGAAAGNGETEMPPEYVGQGGADDAGDGEIEMYSDDVGQAGEDAGGDEIEMPPCMLGEGAKMPEAARSRCPPCMSGERASMPLTRRSSHNTARTRSSQAFTSRLTRTCTRGTPTS
jgi:hypothetical protein